MNANTFTTAWTWWQLFPQSLGTLREGKTEHDPAINQVIECTVNWMFVRRTTALWVKTVWNQRIQFIDKPISHELGSAVDRISEASSAELGNEWGLPADERMAQYSMPRFDRLSTHCAQGSYRSVTLGFPFNFLDASSHLYKRVGPSISPSVRRSVRP